MMFFDAGAGEAGATHPARRQVPMAAEGAKNRPIFSQTVQLGANHAVAMTYDKDDTMGVIEMTL
jgi:hypothetical protein